MNTIGEVFPGNMGRLMLTRVALRLRMPELMKLSPSHGLEPALLARLQSTLAEVRKG